MDGSDEAGEEVIENAIWDLAFTALVLGFGQAAKGIVRHMMGNHPAQEFVDKLLKNTDDIPTAGRAIKKLRKLNLGDDVIREMGERFGQKDYDWLLNKQNLKLSDDIIKKLMKADNFMSYSDDLLGAIQKSNGYADDIIRQVIKYGDDTAVIIGTYGDDAIGFINKYGDDAIDVIYKYEDDAIDVIYKYEDDAIDGLKKDMSPDEIRGMKTSTGSSFARNELVTVLNEQGLTLEEFNSLRLKDVNELSDTQVKQIKAIREAVPKIDCNTVIQKIIPESDIEKYLGEDGYSTIGGYIARYDDVSHIKGYDNVVESLRLDYVTSDGISPYPEGGNTYGYIKFQTYEIDAISIPYGKIFGGTNTDGLPCTLNGFTGARNGEVIPEWILKRRVTLQEGAELHKVIDGEDYIVGIFDGEIFVFQEVIQ